MKLLKDLGMRFPKATSTRKCRFGLYQCPECNGKFEMVTSDVRRSKTGLCKSCSASNAKTTHGMSKGNLYSVWSGQKRRTRNKDSKSYKNYGGRGISMSDEFYNSFDTWYRYISQLDNAFKEGLSLDRCDNDGNYERGNLRWADFHTQSTNTRTSSRNTSGYRGVSFDKHSNRWLVRISTRDGKRVYLGHYDTKEEGAKAYNDYVIANNTEHKLNKI